MKVNLYDLKAKTIGQANLNKNVFGYKINQNLMTQSVRVYLSNQRKSHAKSKSRSEVSGTTKKVWAQKGTGRARHSDRKAPIFVGGGVAHGPKGNQNYKLKMSKKMAKAALRSALSLFAENKKILVISDFDKIGPKTQKAQSLIELLKKTDKKLSSSKKIGLIISSQNSKIKKAFRNLEKINLVYTDSIDTYNILNQNFLIFSDKSLEFVNKNK
jgi:large subunit ribosomal protein L4